MIQALRRKLNDHKGFTLIELIVVIVILGILAAILVPAFLGYADKAKEATDEATIATIKMALALNYAQHENAVSFTVSASGDTNAEGQAIIETVYPEGVRFEYYTNGVDFAIDENGKITDTIRTSPPGSGSQ